ncbi:PHD zinc finger-containing [Chlorella sorokiniana]|uniref:PHD zinc finger-containing n=1 Tax=Chlorella sorokiniana TaxID=3076 RepID=A0A2P6TH74_CHLSO|nr:PHD zinc finger-containing [Chlorella sorokiniana]|eukprot:PRW33616.1 PHD zinc finger-containing [Chlorella sorokiniana]
MEEGGYAANGIKHCVRPMDMSGKSAGMILRRINSRARQEAEQHHLDETCAWLHCLSLDASTRAATLLAQRQSAGGGAGRAGAARQARTPAVERREIWRVLQELIRRVEQRQRQDKLEDVTAQLMLLSAVRKVEAAERLGLDLCQDNGDAAAVLSVLDDVVSFVERPTAAGAAPRQARAAARARSSQAAALEVGRCLHRMVAAVEQQEQAEQQEVVQVAYSMACCVAQEAAAAQLHPCSACGKPSSAAGIVKCSVARCCRQYHWDCLVANPLSRVNDSGRGAKCPLHYCAQCGLSGDGVPMVQCMLCDRGWHPSWQASAAARASLDYGDL